MCTKSSWCSTIGRLVQIIVVIVVDNSQLELSCIAFPLSLSRSVREKDRSTSSSSHHENLNSVILSMLQSRSRAERAQSLKFNWARACA